MTPIKSIRDALYTLVEGIDITGIVMTGWEFKSKYPPKQKVYPGFWVEPISNSTQTLDSRSNQSTYIFWINITESYEDAPMAEDTAIDLADLIYQRVLKACYADTPLATGVFDGTPTGQWGFEERYGERVYRIEVAVRVTEDTYDELVP